MAVNIQFAPVEPDAGTGEVSQATAPTTYVADDVTNESTGDVKHAGDTTHVADATAVESTGEHETAGPSTVTSDWPIGEDKAVSKGETKAHTTPAKKAPAKG